MELSYAQQESYLSAKKRTKAIKGFYVHLIIYCLFVPSIILFNLRFTPKFHWFWISIIGWGINIYFHWSSVFRSKKMNFMKKWEQRKINELINEQN